MVDILFVQDYFERMIGIMQISAVLKQHGFTTDVVVGSRDAVLKKTRQVKPKIIGFYCTTGFHHRALSTAAELKRRHGDGILTVMGGPHPTFVPSVLEADGVDIICRGEGEYAMLELLQALHGGDDYCAIQNLHVKKGDGLQRNGIRPPCDLDALPFPDRDIYRNIDFIYNQGRQEVMVGRGCPFHCSFCANQAFTELYDGLGSYHRLRTVSHVMDELVEIKQKYRPSCFFFHDDNFAVQKDFCSELLAAYGKKIAIPFACLLRADLVTFQLVKLLKESGCYAVYFGIESGDRHLRQQLLRKEISDEEICHCANLLRQQKIPYFTFNMVGLPGERLAEVWKTVELNTRVQPAWAWFSIYQTLPKTELAERAFKQEIVDTIDVAAADANFHESSTALRQQGDGRKIIRLKNWANVMIKLRIATPVVKKIFLHLPLDAAYSWMDRILYYFSYYARLDVGASWLRKIRSAFFLIRHSDAFGSHSKPAKRQS